MTAKKLDLTGQRFGRLVVIKESSNKTKEGKIRWICKCDCGVIKEVARSSLRSGGTKSCGCIVKKHGRAKTPEHNIWVGMKKRCYNKNEPQYKNYGGRGIKVCDRWLESFENFLEDMGERPSKDHSIERIDVYGNYEPNNCKWNTREEQSRNKRISSKNKTGKTGVHLREEGNNRLYFVAQWNNENGKRITKYFPVHVYGYNGAFELACKTRDEAIKSLRNLGVLYGKNHGE